MIDFSAIITEDFYEDVDQYQSATKIEEGMLMYVCIYSADVQEFFLPFSSTDAESFDGNIEVSARTNKSLWIRSQTLFGNESENYALYH